MHPTSNLSTIARHGSASSSCHSSSSSIDTSSHHHSFVHLPNLQTWFQQSVTANHRHERIATGTLRAGMAVLTREMMEMHVHQAPDVRGMLDCLPVVDRANLTMVGWRQKLGTWPAAKRDYFAVQRRVSALV